VSANRELRVSGVFAVGKRIGGMLRLANERNLPCFFIHPESDRER
jgi:hypothetical protein